MLGGRRGTLCEWRRPLSVLGGEVGRGGVEKWLNGISSRLRVFRGVDRLSRGKRTYNVRSILLLPVERLNGNKRDTLTHQYDRARVVFT